MPGWCLGLGGCRQRRRRRPSCVGSAGAECGDDIRRFTRNTTTVTTPHGHQLRVELDGNVDGLSGG